ncbi:MULTISPECIES: hypothetical protein [unclassified Leucobacter]|uniref:hypothetical protein n=1 Tax=unclassified Leucobacter TaxID=2621730 RepID=UPI000699CC07|nr:hypothetical protein [Leucobacter sp. Ag1]
MSAAEDELVRLASGVNWRIDKLTQMQSSLDALKRRVERVRDAIQSGHWEGDAADAAETQLTAIVETFRNASEWVQKVHALIDQHSEDVRSEAQAKLNSLPTGDLPSAVRDAIDRGKPEPMAQYGIIGALTGPAGMLTAGLFFANQREDRAKEAVIELRESIGQKKESLDALIERGFDPVYGKHVGPKKPKQGSSGPGDGEPGTGGPVLGGPGGGVGGGPGVNRGPYLPGPGTHPGVPGPGPGNEVPGPDPDGPPNPGRPPFPGEPPVRPEPPTPGGDPGPGGDGPRNPGDGPSVDSRLDGTIGRTGLGAAGLGAVGLAAGAKIASSGSGLGGVLGGASGLGQGAAGLGVSGGLRGAATAAGAGGASGAGAGGSGASGARGGRPGMMMGGGGGAAGADKKGSKRGLGGYLAPKLEDEGDGGPAARASRAGGRGDDSSDD